MYKIKGDLAALKYLLAAKCKKLNAIWPALRNVSAAKSNSGL